MLNVYDLLNVVNFRLRFASTSDAAPQVRSDKRHRSRTLAIGWLIVGKSRNAG